MVKDQVFNRFKPNFNKLNLQQEDTKQELEKEGFSNVKEERGERREHLF